MRAFIGKPSDGVGFRLAVGLEDNIIILPRRVVNVALVEAELKLGVILVISGWPKTFSHSVDRSLFNRALVLLSIALINALTALGQPNIFNFH